MIPWTVSEQFRQYDFGELSGARIVRIATHPDFQRAGYGKEALRQLEEYYRDGVKIILEEIFNQKRCCAKNSKKTLGLKILRVKNFKGVKDF